MWKEMSPLRGAPVYADHHGIPKEADADVSWGPPPWEKHSAIRM